MPGWRITKLRGEFALTWDDEQGVRRRYNLGTDDAKEAARRAPARYVALTRPVGTTIAALWEGYRIDKAGRPIAETMKYTWKAIEPWFGSIEAVDITTADCRAYVAGRRKAGKSDGTTHTELGHLRSVLVWAWKERIIPHAPHIERPAKPEPKDGYITKDEAARMMEAANAPHIALAIMLMIGTGARSEAALQLTWDRVDFARGIIHLRNPFDKAKRKGRASVPMNDKLRAALSAAHKGAMSLYVIEWAGGPVKSIRKGIKSAGETIGRPDVSPHMLRHSAAVWLAEDGHSMDEIAQFLGHDNPHITYRVYARFSPGHLRKLASSLEF